MSEPKASESSEDGASSTATSLPSRGKSMLAEASSTLGIGSMVVVFRVEIQRFGSRGLPTAADRLAQEVDVHHPIFCRGGTDHAAGMRCILLRLALGRGGFQGFESGREELSASG